MSGEARTTYASKHYAFSLCSGVSRAIAYDPRRPGAIGEFFARAELRYRVRVASLVPAISALVEDARARLGVELREHGFGPREYRDVTTIDSPRSGGRSERFELSLLPAKRIAAATRDDLANRLAAVVWPTPPPAEPEHPEQVGPELSEIGPAARRGTRFSMIIRPGIGIVDAAFAAELTTTLDEFADSVVLRLEPELERLVSSSHLTSLKSVTFRTVADGGPLLEIGAGVHPFSVRAKLAADAKDPEPALEYLGRWLQGIVAAKR